MDIPDSLPESVFLSDVKAPPSTAQLTVQPVKRKVKKVRKIKETVFTKVYVTVKDFSDAQHSKYCKFLDFARRYPHFFKTMVAVIEGKHRVSKRILEHLVTHFAEDRHLILKDEQGKQYNVYQHYKLNRAKRIMDLSRRGPRIPFPFQDRSVETTFTQLEGMKWCMTSPIFEYAEENYDVIKKHLNEYKQIHTKKSTDHIKITPVHNQHFALDIIS